MIRFKNRVDAARRLAQVLTRYTNSPNTVVVGLARGGVVTASEIARILALPLDVLVVRKIGAPYEDELALGAVSEHGLIAYNKQLAKQLNVSEDFIKSSATKEQDECKKRVQLYRSHYPAHALKDKIVLLVDDGIATGSTMEAAIKDLRQQGAKKVIAAVPVIPADTVALLKKLSDEIVYLAAPETFLAVGAFYEDFTQVNHDEVIALLQQQH